eukprot:GHVN01047015.1.p1 GENE.GHVN01047015.1~~GHVN01047015.1.p1  ORF type:complete len:104 (+),score=20.09 GHVN01047015.1:177-488(+)
MTDTSSIFQNIECEPSKEKEEVKPAKLSGGELVLQCLLKILMFVCSLIGNLTQLCKRRANILEDPDNLEYLGYTKRGEAAEEEANAPKNRASRRAAAAKKKKA